ncbi:ABC transporter substrate-binding protein [Aureibacillus halotolerans]|uniref:NitT/TauT family transport system substrate-binding protein n=1 Tax=Aureibacillus halotolerans TaxID=1508390 RepID=A0A4R6UBN0_9BACI|nr:aliphatic sulfonate ABC transporter substrate-binding protein [Aureibacillus halotolerans]TDQ40494.1 NitT/TauT family transport system substrate-binding protein [Aureibacillus halotolerans]
MKKIIFVFSMLLLFVISGCGSSSSNAGEGKTTVTIGYFPNINHTPAMVAREKGFYEETLGDDVQVEYKTFADGGTFMTALQAGEIEAGLVGPGPAMNNFVSGAKVQVVAGSSTGGTVVLASEQSGITTPEDMDGKTFVTPGIGCTHDVQFETFMKEKGLTSNRTGGTLKHVTGKPAQYLGMLKQGRVDVAVAPEPWASVIEADGANVIIDWDEVSFGETLPAAVFATSTKLLEKNPDVVEKLVSAHKRSIDFIQNNKDEAIDITIAGIKDITKQELELTIMERAFERTQFTYDVDPETIQAFGDSSFDLEFYDEQPDFTELVNASFIQ